MNITPGCRKEHGRICAHSADIAGRSFSLDFAGYADPVDEGDVPNGPALPSEELLELTVASHASGLEVQVHSSADCASSQQVIDRS